MAPYLKGMSLAQNDKSMKEYLTTQPIIFELPPIQQFNWKEFVLKSKAFFDTNFLPFIMFLAGGISAFHYHNVLQILGES